MATDDRDPKIGAAPGATDSDESSPQAFVDRDDDLTQGFVDRDYTPDFPGSPAEQDDSEPDPGYAAFASELEDPLADWPAPETPLEDLPEVRHRAALQSDRGNDDADSGAWDTAPPEPPADVFPSPGASSVAWAESDSGERFVQSPGDLPDEHGGGDAGKVSEGDSEEGSEETGEDFTFFDEATDMEEPGDDADDDEYAAMPAGEMLFSDDDLTPLQRSTDAVDNDNVDALEPPDESPRAPEPEQDLQPEPAEVPVAGLGAIPAPPGADDEDEFIDDFLNDLDPPEDDYAESAIDAYVDAARPDDPYADDLLDVPMPDAGESVSAALGSATSIEMAYRGNEHDADERGTDEDTVVKLPETGRTDMMQQDDEKPERSLPVGMLLVVLAALGLLAVGGYGVIQQRSEMQAEIRELQSRLATALSPEEAEAERERQRQIALENESLGAELEALAAENSELSTQLSALEEQLAERTARIAAAEAEAERAAEAARVATEKAAAEKAAASKIAAGRESSTGSANAAEGGPWFVNFGSYAQRDVADRWAGKLSVDDGQVIVQTASAAGKTLYRVRVVGLATQDRAERVATALERQYQLPRLWVGSN